VAVGCALAEGVAAAVAAPVGTVVGVAVWDGELVTVGAPPEHAVTINKASPTGRSPGFMLVPLDRFVTGANAALSRFFASIRAQY
jgi:hypothetical protein